MMNKMQTTPMLASPHENYFNSLHSRYVYWFYNNKHNATRLYEKKKKSKTKRNLLTKTKHPTVIIRPSKKKDVSRPDFYKKKRGGRAGFFNLLFPLACFLYTLLPSPRTTLELFGQILIKRNFRY